MEKNVVSKSVCPFCRKALQKQSTVTDHRRMVEYDLYECPDGHGRFVQHFHTLGEPAQPVAAFAA